MILKMSWSQDFDSPDVRRMISNFWSMLMELRKDESKRASIARMGIEEIS